MNRTYSGTFVADHNKIKEAMKEYVEKTLKTRKIKAMVKRKYPDVDIRFIQPSDHCINHTCKGSCKICSGKDNAIFEKITRGHYKIRDLKS